MFLPAFLPFYMFNQVHNLDLIRDIYVGEIYHNLQIKYNDKNHHIVNMFS